MRIPRGLKVVGILLLLALIGAVSWSRYYWGYFFAPPALPDSVANARAVRAATFVTTHREQDGSRRLVANRELSLSSEAFPGVVEQCRKSPDECHASRAVVALQDRGLLARDLPEVSAEQLAALHAGLDEMGLLVEGDTGYPHAKELNGWVLELEDERVFLALAGLEVSNDHRPFYEVVFERDGARLKPVSAQRYFYDVAGIEGFEWQHMFLVLSILLPALASVGYLLWLAALSLWRSMPFGRAVQRNS